MDAKDIALWMQSELDKHGCIYQDDAVDHTIKAGGETLLRENADGNLVLGRSILTDFRKLNANDVVWVKPEKYWRYRVPEDEPGRDASG